jgi:CheY-like chemotaxis protein
MARILVIDDDDQLRVMMCEVLIRAGHDVSEAANGAEGLAVFRRRPTDLVVTDIFMPEADGFEVILILHRDAPTLPILAVSGGTTRMRLGEEYIGSILRTALRFGASHALRKPFKGQTRDPKRHRTTYPSEVHHPTESLPSFLDGAGQKRGTPGPAHQHEESMPSGIDESGHFLNDTNDHGPRSRADSSCEPDGTDASDTAAADLLKECSDAVSESAPSITDRPVGSDIRKWSSSRA